eukprot:6179045-Pleurochrysis_carterae.AAC.2
MPLPAHDFRVDSIIGFKLPKQKHYQYLHRQHRHWTVCAARNRRNQTPSVFLGSDINHHLYHRAVQHAASSAGLSSSVVGSSEMMWDGGCKQQHIKLPITPPPSLGADFYQQVCFRIYLSIYSHAGELMSERRWQEGGEYSSVNGEYSGM